MTAQQAEPGLEWPSGERLKERHHPQEQARETEEVKIGVSPHFHYTNTQVSQIVKEEEKNQPGAASGVASGAACPYRELGEREFQCEVSPMEVYHARSGGM